jgi:hypothetical protein
MFLVAALRTGNTERLFQRHVGIGGAGCTIKSTKQVGTAERYNSGHERSSRSTTLPQSRVNLDKSTHSIDGETQMGNANGQANGS